MCAEKFTGIALAWGVDGGGVSVVLHLHPHTRQRPHEIRCPACLALMIWSAWWHILFLVALLEWQSDPITALTPFRIDFSTRTATNSNKALTADKTNSVKGPSSLHTDNSKLPVGQESDRHRTGTVWHQHHRSVGTGHMFEKVQYLYVYYICFVAYIDQVLLWV